MEKRGEETIDAKIDELASIITQGFINTQKEVRESLTAINERMDGIDARLGEVQRVQMKLTNQVADIQDDLTSALSASDNDGSAILNHEHRISHLEKIGGITSIPAEHLIGLE